MTYLPCYTLKIKIRQATMRLLMWHVDHFTSTPGQRGRSSTFDEHPWDVSANNAILVFAAAEPTDETDPEQIAKLTSEEILNLATKLKVKTVVLHSFAHLFGELAQPAIAHNILTIIQHILESSSLDCCQTPFGWFNALDIKAKGHPLSRVARTISLPES
jgi:hypothetical protein